MQSFFTCFKIGKYEKRFIIPTSTCTRDTTAAPCPRSPRCSTGGRSRPGTPRPRRPRCATRSNNGGTPAPGRQSSGSRRAAARSGGRAPRRTVACKTSPWSHRVSAAPAGRHTVRPLPQCTRNAPPPGALHRHRPPGAPCWRPLCSGAGPHRPRRQPCLSCPLPALDGFVQGRLKI